MSFLYVATFAVNLLALVLSIWLGLYLISRNPRHAIAWLTALMLWFMAAVFLNELLAINPPPAVSLKLNWLRYFFPFWPRETLAGTNHNWLQGWSLAPALALWHHVTVLLLPGRTNGWRWTRILLGYLLAVVAIFVQTNAQILFSAESSSPLYLNSLQAGPWYSIFAIALLILTWTCVFNLIIAARNAPTSIARKQLLVLAWAALVAGLAGPVSIAGSYFMIPIPMLVVSVLEGLPVGLIGWGVARYSALMEERTIQKDFIYNLVLLGFVLLIYIPISWLLLLIYHAPMVILAVFPVLAVLTHSSMTVLYRLMDRLFYKKETRQLRLQLRQITRQVGIYETLDDLLSPSLETICSAVSASYGLILVFEDTVANRVVSYHIDGGIPVLDPQKIAADDVVQLQPNTFPPPLAEASILVPLYGEEEQLGALMLGRPINGVYYAVDDVDKILDFTDRVSEMILLYQRNVQYMSHIAQFMQRQDLSDSKKKTPISTEGLELALRNLYDYTYLADNPLGELMLVQTRLTRGQVTHLDRGKMVHTVLLEALEKLRPTPEEPSKPPTRVWYPYLILQEAYLKETSNRDIMMKLYISEGTFNRTRRTAVRSLARALGELEASIS